MALGIPEIPGNSHRFPLIPGYSRGFWESRIAGRSQIPASLENFFGSLSTRFALDNTLIPNKKQEALALTQTRVIFTSIAFKTPLCSILEMSWPHCLIDACVIGRILKPAFGDGDSKARELELELERELELEVPGLEANRVIASALCTSTVVEVVVCPGGALMLAFLAFLAALAEVPELCNLVSSGQAKHESRCSPNLVVFVVPALPSVLSWISVPSNDCSEQEQTRCLHQYLELP